MQWVYLGIPLAPLLGAVLAGFFGRVIGRSGAHVVTIAGVAASFILSLIVLKAHVFDGAAPVNYSLYTWAQIAGLKFEIGFLVDNLTTLMLCVVTFVSLMVHVYTIGYMHEDPGYQRFFSYIALFTFAMLMLVMSNNFLQLFFGWEAVGLVSYLLIGFWFTKPTAVKANMKAFLVNRVGDLGFLLGIAGVLAYTGSLNYSDVFAKAPQLTGLNLSLYAGHSWDVLTAICLCLFVGAMGKSAQVPLHVWLPDSMEGPTPISALIHAATMVTAGVFMVARMSPLFELSETALSAIMVIGATTAFFMGLIGLVQNDIKRVVAYSTLSQLGYMVVALGASAYSAAIFHLMTHAFFKALLFLAAGSVIIGMHHEQDIRKMGGLKKYMPITYWTSLIGSLALIGVPGLSGFYSKDAIIEAVGLSTLHGAGYAYICVLSGVFITALYSFRMFFLVFHGKERMDHHTQEHLHESPAVVWLPLVLLAIPSAFLGGMAIESVVFGDYFGGAIHVLGTHNVLAEMKEEFHGPLGAILHGLQHAPFWLAASGVFVAWLCYLKAPAISVQVAKRFSLVKNILEDKYGFDRLYESVFAAGGRNLGKLFWRVGDMFFIDGLAVNGTAKVVAYSSTVVRHIQSGYLYHYAFAMIIGLLALLGWLQFVI